MAKEIRDQGVQALLDKEIYDWIHPVLRKLQSRVVRIVSSDGKCSSGVIIGTDLVLTTGHGVNNKYECIVSQGDQKCSGSVQDLTHDELHQLGILATNSDLAVVKVEKPFEMFQSDWSSVVAPRDMNPNVLIFLGFCGNTGVMRCSVASCITEPLQRVRNDLKVGSVLTWNLNATRGYVLSIAMLDDQNWVIEVELGGGSKRVFHSNDEGTVMVKGNTYVKPAGGVNLLSPVQHSDSHTLAGNITSAGGSGGAYFTLSGELFGVHIGANGGFRLMVKPYIPCFDVEIERQVVPECRSIVNALHKLAKNRPPPVIPAEEWVQGLKHDTGRLTYKNGDCYDGEWVRGKRHGKGKYLYKEGSKFLGNWESDVISGDGTMSYPNGDEYTGQWWGGQRHGTGRLTYDNGDCYDGEWIQGKRHGTGECLFKGGSRYFGNWENDMMNGKGTIYLSSGDQYTGDWKDDYCHGSVIYKYNNGVEYEGEWRYDGRHGRGRMTYSLDPSPGVEKRFEGEWFELDKDLRVMLSIRRSDVPRYLRESEFYYSLSEEDEEDISVPKNCFKFNDVVRDDHDLRLLLSTLRFWVTEQIPNGLISFVLANCGGAVCQVFSEFSKELKYLPFLVTLALTEKSARLSLTCERGNTQVLRYLLNNGYVASDILVRVASHNDHKECLQLVNHSIHHREEVPLQEVEPAWYRPYVESESGSECIISRNTETRNDGEAHSQANVLKAHFELNKVVKSVQVVYDPLTFEPICFVEVQTLDVGSIAQHIVSILAGRICIRIIVDNFLGNYTWNNIEYDTLDNDVWENLDWASVQYNHSTLPILLESLPVCAPCHVFFGPTYSYADGQWSTDVCIWVVLSCPQLRCFSTAPYPDRPMQYAGLVVQYFVGQMELHADQFVASTSHDHLHLGAKDSVHLRSGSLFWVAGSRGPLDLRKGTIGPNLRDLLPDVRVPTTWYLTCEHIFNYEISLGEWHYSVIGTTPIHTRHDTKCGVLVHYSSDDQAIIDVTFPTKSGIRLNQDASTNVVGWLSADSDIDMSSTLEFLLTTHPPPPVFKSGATTGVTQGSVVTYGLKRIDNSGCEQDRENETFLYIRPHQESYPMGQGQKSFSFSDAGDSGASVFMRQGNTDDSFVLGLLNGIIRDCNLSCVRILNRSHLLSRIHTRLANAATQKPGFWRKLSSIFFK